MPDVSAPTKNPWELGSHPLQKDYQTNGRSNAGWGTIDTAHQVIHGSLRLNAYNLAKQDPKPSSASAAKWRDTHDWYAVSGHFSHSVTHNAEPNQVYNPGLNWVSVGYYGTDMSLVLELLQDPAATPGNGAAADVGRVWEAGPPTTVGSSSASYNIGGGLSAGFFGDTPTGDASLSGGFSSSYTTPNVVIGEAEVGNLVRWNVKLPGVGFNRPADPPNPLPPSSDGYGWEFAAIFQIPAGHKFRLRVHPYVRWEYNWTRGIINDVKTWAEDMTLDWEDGVS
jgi:hypothetical protein